MTALVGVCAKDQQLPNDDVVDYVVSRVQRQAPVVTSAVSGEATADGKQKAVPFLTSFQRLVSDFKQFKSAEKSKRFHSFFILSVKINWMQPTKLIIRQQTRSISLQFQPTKG